MMLNMLFITYKGNVLIYYLENNLNWYIKKTFISKHDAKKKKKITTANHAAAISHKH